MKIGFTGAGSTGKTTTLNLIKDEVNVPILPSSTREVFKKWNIKEDQQENMSPEDKLLLQNDIFDMRDRIEIEAGHSFISDRVLLDNFAYSLLRCYLAMGREMVDSKEAQVLENLKTYDLLFYFPITFTPIQDEMRHANYALLKTIDSIIYAFLTKHGFDFITVPAGSPEDRAKYVLSFITEMESSK
tara:strand:- start:583 stop:1143 length:561 start_codon:yes stop_codon:yes gene_type:complete